MGSEIFSRNELYWGKDFQKRLSSLKIVVAGIGGVGGFALEALARAGVEHFLIIDFDTISKTNINRQIIALQSTVGQKKTEVFSKRLKNINPEVEVQIYDGFYSKEANDKIFTGEFERPDFTIDAIDTMKSKIELLDFCRKNALNVVSSLGAGNRLDPTKLKVCDISEVKSKDVFVKNVLSKLKKYTGIESGLTVIVSEETAHSVEKIKNVEKVLDFNGNEIEFTKFTPASTPVVPAVAGYFIAGHILQTCYNDFFGKKR